ncbi:MAG: N-6 DNA methylase [Desulfarculales bacterium]|jgi:SAM-dependent methyltransferase|nr:N-6 DNA methylase [Desulfarculales bacterium]
MALTAELYEIASNEYENSLTDEFKKDNGVFYTDLSLAEKMLTAVKPFLNQDTSVILDPCCGVGCFLFAAHKYGYKHVYGIDVDSAAISFCADSIEGTTLIKSDFIGNSAKDTLSLLELADKVDCIIGNPPYVPVGDRVEINGDYIFRREVSDSGNNLFVAALIRSLELLKDGGVLSYIIPKNFLHVASYSLLRRKIINEYTIVSIIDLGQYFKNVRGEQIVLTIRKKTPLTNQNKVQIRVYKANRFPLLCKVYQSFYKDEILLFDCDTDREVFVQLTDTYKTLKDYCNGYVGRGKSTSDGAITGNDIRKFGYKDKAMPNDDGNQIFIQNIYSAEAGVIAAFGGKLEAAQTVTIFTDGDAKMCRYILGVIHSRLCNFFLYRYCYNRSHLTMHTDAKYLKKIPLPNKSSEEFRKDFDKILPVVSALESDEYLTRQWFEDMERLNKVVYEIYGMTAELSEYIDTEVKKFQSRRWISFE